MEKLTILAKYKEKVEKKVHQKYKYKSGNVKLSKLEIRKFSAEPTAWNTFIDSFEASVDRSTNLSDAENSITYYHICKKTLYTLYKACRQQMQITRRL